MVPFFRLFGLQFDKIIVFCYNNKRVSGIGSQAWPCADPVSSRVAALSQSYVHFLLRNSPAAGAAGFLFMRPPNSSFPPNSPIRAREPCAGWRAEQSKTPAGIYARCSSANQKENAFRSREHPPSAMRKRNIPHPFTHISLRRCRVVARSKSLISHQNATETKKQARLRKDERQGTAARDRKPRRKGCS